MEEKIMEDIETTEEGCNKWDESKDIGTGVLKLKALKDKYGTLEQFELLNKRISPWEMWNYLKIRSCLRDYGVDVMI